MFLERLEFTVQAAEYHYFFCCKGCRWQYREHRWLEKEREVFQERNFSHLLRPI
jgi:hypothetical protein